MKRRDFIKTAGAGIAFAGFTNTLLSQSHNHASTKKKKKASSGKYSKAKMHAIHCILASEDCLSHCLEEMGKGDKSLAGCAESTRDTIATCRAFLSMASQESKFTKKIASLCVEVCESCIKECKKHADHHSECKECMDSCISCVKELKKI